MESDATIRSRGVCSMPFYVNTNPWSPLVLVVYRKLSPGIFTTNKNVAKILLKGSHLSAVAAEQRL